MTDEKKTIKFQMMMSPSEADAFDDWGFSHRIRSRAEAIRRLASLGLNQKSTEDLASAATAVAMRFLSKETPTVEEVSSFLEALQKNLISLEKRTKLALNTHVDLLVQQHIDKNPDRKLSYDAARAEIADQVNEVYQADADLAAELAKNGRRK